MSSYKKVGNDNVVFKKEKYVIGEKFLGKEKNFLENEEISSLEELKKEMEDKRNQMIDEIEREREQIISQLKEEAYEKAYNEAKKEIEQEWDEKFKEVNEEYQEAEKYKKDIIDQLEMKKNKLIKENEEEIIDIALSLTKKIVSENIKEQKELYREYLQNSIDEVSGGNKKIYITMNPKAFRKIEPFEYKNVEILLDNELKYEDILVETEREIIDLTLEERIKQWRKILIGV